jgi:outer membrane lipoprotein carrier protein
MSFVAIFSIKLSMHKFLLKTGLVIAAVCLLAQFALADEAANKIAARVDKKYNALQTFKADFVESYSGAGVERQESGTLSLKRPGRMRWDYRTPTEKLFVSDGKTAFFYVPGERQARKTEVKKLDDLRSPLRYLLGKTKLEKEFENLIIADAVKAKTPGNVVLSGVPKNMADRVSKVLFEISPESQIERIVIEEVDGTTTEFQFRNMVENVNIPEEQFHFKAPEGVETIQAAEMIGN